MTTILWCLILLFHHEAGTAQISTALPKTFISATMIDFGLSNLSDKVRDEINQEITDPKFIEALGKTTGLSNSDLATVRVVNVPSSLGLEIYQIGKPDKGFELISALLKSYADRRGAGHTKEFSFMAMTNRMNHSSIFDHDLALLIRAKPELPSDLLKLDDFGTRTNKTGETVSQSTSVSMVNGRPQTNVTAYSPKQDEICRWVSYFLVDGEIAWTYFMQLKADDSFDYVSEQKVDAKEFDPKFKKIIHDIDAEIQAEMKKNGTSGHLGSVHTYWRLKKERLKAKGIDWQSPAELNQNIIFD